MTAEVVKLKLASGVGAGVKVSTNKVLRGARAAGLTECLVIGTAPDGSLYGASTEGPADTLWLVEFFKNWLLNGCPEDE